MSKAEERALKAYPKATREIGGIVVDIGHPQYMRDLYIEGYNQAQQDYIEYAQLWVDSGEVNIKSFKQFLKDRGYE